MSTSAPSTSAAAAASSPAWRGYYSKKGADLSGYIVYKRADGSIVNVTEVKMQPPYVPSGEWPDLEDVGEVVTYVKNVPGKNVISGSLATRRTSQGLRKNASLDTQHDAAEF